MYREPVEIESALKLPGSRMDQKDDFISGEVSDFTLKEGRTLELARARGSR